MTAVMPRGETRRTFAAEFYDILRTELRVTHNTLSRRTDERVRACLTRYVSTRLHHCKKAFHPSVSPVNVNRKQAHVQYILRLLESSFLHEGHIAVNSSSRTAFGFVGGSSDTGVESADLAPDVDDGGKNVNWTGTRSFNLSNVSHARRKLI